MIWTMRIIGVMILAIGLIIEQNGSEAGSFIGAVGVAWIIVFLFVADGSRRRRDRGR